MWHLYMRLNINIRSAVCFQLKISSRIYDDLPSNGGTFFRFKSWIQETKKAGIVLYVALQAVGNNVPIMDNFC